MATKSTFLSRDRAGGDPPADRGDRRRSGPRARRGRPVREVQGEDLAVRARAARRPAGREARLRHGDHADEVRRGQDDDLGLAHAGPRRDRQEARPLPARGVARPRVRDQGRCRRRGLRAGRPDGGHEPPLHGRHPRDRRGEQPARGDARGAPAARERARHRSAHRLVAALRRHQRPRAARHRRRPRRPRERLSAPDGLGHHRSFRGDGDRRRRARPVRPARAARRDHRRLDVRGRSPSPPSS